jgi:hypothetical protein
MSENLTVGQEVRAPFHADESIRCSFLIGTGEFEDPGVEMAEPCANSSQFVVSRSDGDASYGINGGSDECCAAHLADTVDGMVAGDDKVQAIVAIRWWDTGSDDNNKPGGNRP